MEAKKAADVFPSEVVQWEKGGKRSDTAGKRRKTRLHLLSMPGSLLKLRWKKSAKGLQPCVSKRKAASRRQASNAAIKNRGDRKGAISISLSPKVQFIEYKDMIWTKAIVNR